MAVVSVLDIYLHMGNVIKNAGLISPAPPLILKSLEPPRLTGTEEWLSFELLLEDYHVARRIQHEETVSFQLVCFTLESSSRADKKFARHYELATIYQPLLHQQDYHIKNTCVRFKECKIAYLDLRTSTFTAQAISTGGTPPLQTQSAVLLVDACIITNKG